MKTLFLALALAGCAPLPVTPVHVAKWKGPFIAPLEHVNCRPVNDGKWKNSGCVA